MLKMTKNMKYYGYFNLIEKNMEKVRFLNKYAHDFFKKP